MTPSWFRHARHGLLLVALMAALPLAAARAGQTLLDPGASGTIDTGERGNYTATTIYDLGDQAGRVEFGANPSEGLFGDDEAARLALARHEGAHRRGVTVIGVEQQPLEI